VAEAGLQTIGGEYFVVIHSKVIAIHIVKKKKI